jgi:antitoxin (DNA-binding transcriptional repressor) of toxin-antitoxin stability system
VQVFCIFGVFRDCKNKEKSMSITITIEEAQARLRDFIHQLGPGDEIIITENQQTVATLKSKPLLPRKPRMPGNCKGMITLLVEDDEHLEGFKEYME